MTPIETVLAFMDRINERDPDKLAELMSEDHAFMDSLGQATRGRETMRKGWQGYYALCPDYWVSHEDVLENGNVVAVFGAAGGTIGGHGKLTAADKWQTPAAWRAVVEKGLVKEWRVYADNKPVYDIMAKSAAPIK
jgi:ketosteroid isomerase-like protein